MPRDRRTSYSTALPHPCNCGVNFTLAHRCTVGPPCQAQAAVDTAESHDLPAESETQSHA